MLRHVFIRYTVALLAVIACLELRLLLNPFLGVNVPFITFFFGVMVAAWYGGFGPGIVAALASTVVADHFFIAPVGSFSFNSANVLALSLFVMEAIGISVLSEALHRAKQEAEDGSLKMKHLLDSISEAFVAVDTMPGWLQPIAEANPFTKVTDASRALYNGQSPGADLWISIAWAVGITVVFGLLYAYFRAKGGYRAVKLQGAGEAS